MRKISLLISASRRATENEEYTENAGIQDEEFIQYLNDGQEEIHSIISSTFPHILMKSKEIQAVQSQEGYSLPFDVYLGTRVDMVEYSATGRPQDYYPLKKGSLKERLNGLNGSPAFYIRNGGEVLIQPPPMQAGKIRITYQKATSRLDTQRASVLSVTTSGNALTSLFLDPGMVIEDTALLEENYLSIVDKNGVMKMAQIPVDAINTTTGEVTISAGFSFEDGESISVGDIAVRGKYSSTHSMLPDVCEKYLLEYCNARILMRDSSTDSSALSQIMAKVQQTIQTAFAEPDSDPDYVPVLDNQYLGWDG